MELKPKIDGDNDVKEEQQGNGNDAVKKELQGDGDGFVEETTPWR